MTPYKTPRLSGASTPNDIKKKKSSSGACIHPYMKNEKKDKFLGTEEIQETFKRLFAKPPRVTSIDFRISK